MTWRAVASDLARIWILRARVRYLEVKLAVLLWLRGRRRAP